LIKKPLFRYLHEIGCHLNQRDPELKVAKADKPKIVMKRLPVLTMLK
jgi:hypothetical protein